MGRTVRPDNPPFERSSFGGSLELGGAVPRRHLAAAEAHASPGFVLVGYACVYLKAHRHQGRVEAFSRGCFADSVRASHRVSFLRGHSWAQHLGSTGDGRLELFEDDTGLAFALGPGDDDDGRALLADVRAGQLQMSAGYEVQEDETRLIDGEPVRVIRKALLREVSAVPNPAVKQTTITAVSGATFGGLKAACRAGEMARHVAAANVERGLAKLLAALA